MATEQESERPFSQGSARFRESTHLIPTPGTDGAPKRPRRYEPLIMHLAVVLVVSVLMIAFGIGLEVALDISQKRGGFRVPEQNVFAFASAQFLLSFFPTLLIIPVAYLWREMDWMLRWYQPYVVLSRGNATAAESILLDYIALGTSFTLWHSMKHKHRLIFYSALSAAATYLFQPLAGSIFQLGTFSQVYYSTATSIRTIGLAPDIDQLNAFVAAAGFAEAAVYNNLSDPSFVQQGWATAIFTFPENPILNGSMTVNTTGVQTSTNCHNPASMSLDTIAGNSSSVVINATSVEGCARVLTVDTSVASQQYGVVNVTCNGGPTNGTFQPVMFWFYHLRDSDSSPEAKTVFCTPTIEIFNVMATANLNNGSLANVTTLTGYTTANNVTGAPLNGQAFNGVIFDPNPNPFIQARAVAVNSGVPGAIFRFASQFGSGLQNFFDLPSGFLDATTSVYTQHLSLVAKSIYFVPANQELSARMVALQTRLRINPLAGHALAFVLFLVGLTGLFIHLLSRQARRQVWLTSPPGSIAAIVSLTSRSGFGELLLPYDDEKTMKKKLSEFRFRLDRRTGAILAEDLQEGINMDMGRQGGRDDAMMSLLGKGPTSEHSLSSTNYAMQAASGYPPWQFKTPYDVDP